jgi:outer membrane receptor protein involved in Fe transport
LELADYTLRVPGITPQRAFKSGNETENIRYSLGLRGDFELGSKAWRYDASFTRGENTFRTNALEIDKNKLELAMYGLGGPDCTPNGSLDPSDPRARAARFALAGLNGEFSPDDTGLDSGPLEPVYLALAGTVPDFAFINPDNLVMAMTSSNNGDVDQGCYFFNPMLTREDGSFVDRNPFTPPTAGVNPNLVTPDEVLRWMEFEMEDYQRTDTFLNSFDLVFAGELFEFNGNMVELAVGGQYREEGRETAVHPQITGSVNSFGFLVGGASVGGLSENRNFDAERDVYAVFAEFAIPLTDSLDIQLAGRYEDYGGEIGDTFDPKLAVRWQATNRLVLRGSVASAFRGPAISQVVEGTGFSLEFGVRDVLGEDGTRAEGQNCVKTGRCAIPADDVAPTIIIVKQGRASPDLQPEKAVTWNVGAIWNPTDSSQIGLDYYRIDFEDKIIDVPTQAFLTEERGLFEAARAAGDFTIVDVRQANFGQSCDPTDGIYDPGNPLAEICQVNPLAYQITESTSEFNGNITRRADVSRDLQIIASNAINTGKVESHGIDANLLWTWDTGIGQFLLDGRLNYVIDHKVKDFPVGQPDYNAAGFANRGPERRLSASMPDLKANAGLTWFRDNHYARLGWRYVGSYTDDSVPALRLTEKFDPYHSIDLAYSYTWSMGGAGEVQLTLGAIDLFDATLPNVKDARGVDLTVFDQRGRRLYASLLYRI